MLNPSSAASLALMHARPLLARSQTPGLHLQQSSPGLGPRMRNQWCRVSATGPVYCSKAPLLHTPKAQTC